MPEDGTGTQPVRRPCDLRHAALSLWLASGRPTRRDRCPRRAQRPRPAHHLYPRHSRLRPDRQPAHRASPPPQLLAPRWPTTIPRRRRESRPSCVRATTGPSGTQLDLIPPPSSGYMFLTCGNTDPRGRLADRGPRTGGVGHSFSIRRRPAQIWPTAGAQLPGTVCRTAPGHASDPASGNTGTGSDLGF
jgi:hypothetical protein